MELHPAGANQGFSMADPNSLPLGLVLPTCRMGPVTSPSWGSMGELAKGVWIYFPTMQPHCPAVTYLASGQKPPQETV